MVRISARSVFLLSSRCFMHSIFGTPVPNPPAPPRVLTFNGTVLHTCVRACQTSQERDGHGCRHGIMFVSHRQPGGVSRSTERHCIDNVRHPSLHQCSSCRWLAEHFLAFGMRVRPRHDLAAIHMVYRLADSHTRWPVIFLCIVKIWFGSDREYATDEQEHQIDVSTRRWH